MIAKANANFAVGFCFAFGVADSITPSQDRCDGNSSYIGIAASQSMDLTGGTVSDFVMVCFSWPLPSVQMFIFAVMSICRDRRVHGRCDRLSNERLKKMNHNSMRFSVAH